MKVIGIMSGTSLDGIDVALCEINGSGPTLAAEVLDFICVPFAAELREKILSACLGEAKVGDIALLNVELGEAFALATNILIEKHGPVDLIGSHGQTVAHHPAHMVTVQIGEGAIIAARTGTTVVCDFRPRDLAEGGQGAPLVPYADYVLLRSDTLNRVILNIGGIANCTLLPAGCSLEEVRAWDTGPGNMVIDECARHLFDVPFDKDGELAAKGNPASWFYGDMGRLHPFFSRKPPKSAGREEFGPHFAAQFFRINRDPHDILAEVTWITAHSIANSLRAHGGVGEGWQLIIGGGGAFNPTLLTMLKNELPGIEVLRHEDVGIASDSKEALAFAILAAETMRGVATSVPSATGAWRPAVLGKIVPA